MKEWSRHGVRLVGSGLALFGIGVALNIWFPAGRAVAAPYILGSALTGLGLGYLLTFGRNLAVVRILVAVIVAVVGTVAGMMVLDRVFHPPPPIELSDPEPLLTEKDKALMRQLEAMANARVVKPKYSVTLRAVETVTEQELDAAFGPFKCAADCPAETLVTVVGVARADGAEYRTLVAVTDDPAERARFEKVVAGLRLQPAQAASDAGSSSNK